VALGSRGPDACKRLGLQAACPLGLLQQAEQANGEQAGVVNFRAFYLLENPSDGFRVLAFALALRGQLGPPPGCACRPY